MNYIEYLQEGGFLKSVPLKNYLLPSSGANLLTDDWKGFYEYLRLKFGKSKENSTVPVKNNSSTVVGVKDGIAYYGTNIPNNDSLHYIRIDNKTDNKLFPSWILFRS